MSIKNWFKFIGLGLIWGSSFLWIKIALQEVGPFTLVTMRVGFALLTTLVVILISRPRLPLKKYLPVFLFMGLFNTAVPFALISWSETHISSGLAAILNSTVPLFTILIAPFFLKDDPFTLPKVAGLLIGFGGVVLLMSNQAGGSGNILGYAGMLLATFSYACAAVYGRRRTSGLPAEVMTLGQMSMAFLVILPTTAVVEAPFHLAGLPLTWLAVAWLGILGTSLATLIFYSLLHDIGPTRTTLVTYMFPLVGVILGMIFLREEIDWQMIVGGLMIIGSIMIVNKKFNGRKAPATARESLAP